MKLGEYMNAIENNVGDRLALKSGVLYLFAELITRGISFLATPVFTRLLPKEVFADARIFESWTYLLAPVISLSMYQSIARAKLDYNDEFPKYLSSVLTLLVLLTVVILGIGVFVWPLAARLLGFEWPLLLLMLMYSLSYNGLQCVQIYERQVMNYRANVVLTVLAVVPGVVISVVCVALLGNTMTAEELLNLRLFSFFMPTTLIGIVVMIWACRRGREFVSVSKWRYAIRYSVPMMATAISSQVFFQSATIVVRNMVGASEAALVAIAMTVGYIMDILVHAIDNAWRPWMYEKMQAGKTDDVRRLWRVLLMGVVLIVWCLTMAAPELILLLGGKDYMNAVRLICPILCGSLANFLLIEYTAVEQYYKKTRISGLTSLIAAAIDIVLNILFVKLFGYVSVVYTTAAAYLLACIIHYVLIRGFEKDNVLSTGRSFAIIIGTFVLCMFSTLCYGLGTLARLAIVLVVFGCGAAALRKPLIGVMQSFLGKH